MSGADSSPAQHILRRLSLPAMSRPVGSAIATNIPNVAGDEEETLNVVTDPILSPGLASVPTSRARIDDDGLSTAPEGNALAVNEHDPLLGGDRHGQRRKKPFYRPRPLWYVLIKHLTEISSFTA